MKIHPLAASMFQNLKTSAVRFPLPVLLAFLFFLFSLNQIYDWNWFIKEKEVRVSAILISGFFWFGGFKLFVESNRKSPLLYLAISLPLFAAIAAYIYYAHYGLSVFNFIISSLIVFITVAPFLIRNSSDAAFYNFNREMWIGFFYAVLLSLIFCGGLCAIVATINELFNAGIGNKIYASIWALGATFLAPYYALSWVRRNFANEEEAYIPKGIKFILTYILVPFGIIYLGILYAYALKILIQWQLPEGKLSYMICGFGAIGSFVHLAAYPLRGSGNHLVKFFNKYFCIAFLPLIPLLFLAIGVRISEYGVTESRYAITLAGIWFAVTTIIYILRKDTHSMKYGPAILSLLLMLAAFGPWGAVSISEKSQVSRLEKLLVKNNILQNGKIHPAKNEVSLDDRISITSIISYLNSTDKLDAIKPWFAPDMNIYKATRRYDYYQIMDDLGIKAANRWDKPFQRLDHFSFYTNDYNQTINITGYDQLIIGLRSSNYGHYDRDADPDRPKISLENNNVIISYDKHDTRVNLEPLVKELQKIPNQNPKELAKKMFIEAGDDKYKFKLLITALSGDNIDSIKITNVNFDLLVKKTGF